MALLINALTIASIVIAVIGALVLVAAGLVTIWACLFDRRSYIGQEDDEYSNRDRLERRLRAVNPDHPGEIVPFKKRRVG